MLRRVLAGLACLVVVGTMGQAHAADDTIKIGFMDPFSGTFAQVGDQNLKQMNYILDTVNQTMPPMGKKFELVTCDTKTQPSEALICLKSFTDQNLPMFLHCSGSNIAAALIEAVAKHNERNPDNRIIYLNCGAVATELTNEKCDFWHFRFDLHASQKALAIVKALPKDVTKVYLLNQDYLFGQSVQRDVNAYLKELRSDVQVVGDELIPLGKVKDFSPYVAKIKASGAEALITGNWGPDMSLLVKAGLESGLPTRYYTMYAHLAGGATAIGAPGDGKVLVVQAYNENVAVDIKNADLETWTATFRQTNNFDFYGAGFRTMFEMMSKAINEAGSTKPIDVARALEGMEHTDMTGQPVVMRADDHQLIGPYYVASFVKGVKYDSEKTGLGWKTETTLTGKDVEQPTTCQMKRPE